MARLLAAMSGGVDSAVAAALCVRDGHDVTGVTLKQWEHPDDAFRRSKGCCTLDAVDDARKAADALGIAHYTFDFREIFSREVIDVFVSEYAAGRTPNPCVRCNQKVRFGHLLDKAEALGFDGLITGHYARTRRDPDAVRLLRARCVDRDQSYVLHAIGQRGLSKAWFPLGEFTSKDEVRDLASEFGLPNAGREDSVEVCFVPEGQTAGDLVGTYVPDANRPGPIRDANGTVVGTHTGLARYTIGQRRRLGISAPTPRYVTSIDAASNTLTIGDVADLDSLEVFGVEPTWVVAEPAEGSTVEVCVRYHADPVKAVFQREPNGIRLRLAEPVSAVAPGQSVVLYDGDEVLGGATIAS